MSSGLALEAEGGRWKRYPAYRDSGVEWLGSCPRHWCTTRIRDNVNLVNGYPFDSNLFDIGDGIPLVRIRDILNDQTGIVWTGEAVPEAAINNGDILIGMDGDFNVSWWNGGYAMLNQRVCCIRVKTNNLDQRFIFYLLHFPLKIINDLAYSTTVKHLSSFDVLKTRFARPSIEEQRAIAAFLDRETGRIDALIAKKERQIELLQEKRAALISHAVTKGLDPDAPMRDSGVEWLEEIPEHWEIMNLKRIGKVRYGLGQPPSELNEGVPLIRATNINRGKISDEGMLFINPDEVPESRDAVLSEGEIIIVRSGAYTGDSAIIPFKYAGAIAGYDTVFTINKGINRYFAWQILSKEIQDLQFGFNKLRAAQPHLNAEEINEIIIVNPLFEEQKAIAAFLDCETWRIDTLTTKVRESISKLREYRTALISAAVTGKIDVRGEET